MSRSFSFSSSRFLSASLAVAVCALMLPPALGLSQPLPEEYRSPLDERMKNLAHTAREKRQELEYTVNHFENWCGEVTNRTNELMRQRQLFLDSPLTDDKPRAHLQQGNAERVLEGTSILVERLEDTCSKWNQLFFGMIHASTTLVKSLETARHAITSPPSIGQLQRTATGRRHRIIARRRLRNSRVLTQISSRHRTMKDPKEAMHFAAKEIKALLSRMEFQQMAELDQEKYCGKMAQGAKKEAEESKKEIGEEARKSKMLTKQLHRAVARENVLVEFFDELHSLHSAQTDATRGYLAAFDTSLAYFHWFDSALKELDQIAAMLEGEGFGDDLLFPHYDAMDAVQRLLDLVNESSPAMRSLGEATIAASATAMDAAKKEMDDQKVLITELETEASDARVAAEDAEEEERRAAEELETVRRGCFEQTTPDMRRENRLSEIESLKNSLEILEGMDGADSRWSGKWLDAWDGSRPSAAAPPPTPDANARVPITATTALEDAARELDLPDTP